jgi:uncharacterized membrane protein YkoI
MVQAKQAATRQTHGKVIETELENENGFLVWEVKSIAQDGSLTEVYIDAGNGKCSPWSKRKRRKANANNAR